MSNKRKTEVIPESESMDLGLCNTEDITTNTDSIPQTIEYNFEKVANYTYTVKNKRVTIEFDEETGDPSEGTIKFLFCISRMNPPTPGHLLLIEQMIYIAKKENIEDVFIILSETLDKKNPLKCDDQTSIVKKNVLSRMVEKVKEETGFDGNIHIICNKIPLTSVIPIIKEYYGDRLATEKIKLILVAGSDRCEDYLKSVPSCTFKYEEEGEQKIGSYRLMVLPRDEMKAAISNVESIEDWGSIPRAAMSGSFIRELVKKGKHDGFSQVYSKYLVLPNGEPDNEFIREFYDEIENGMKNNPNPKASRDSPDPIGACEGPSQFFILNRVPLGGRSFTQRRRRQQRKDRRTKRNRSRRQRRWRA